MKCEIAGMMDWFLLMLWLILLVLTILFDMGIIFSTERNYWFLYAACVLGIGLRIVRIVKRKKGALRGEEEDE